MKPRLAVIVPCFNNVETIGEAVGSALVQDYDQFEVHVCDNASTDGTAELLRRFGNPRLRLHLHGDNVPRTVNWNRAYEAGFEADFLVTLHADDRLAPGALEAIAAAARSGPALIHGLCRGIAYDGTPVAGTRFPFTYRCTGDDFRELLLLNNMVAMPGATVRTDVFRAAGCWDPDWNYLQDLELWWRCAARGEILYLGRLVGYQRAMKVPDRIPRHAAEHLAWTVEKLRAVETPRLRRAAAGGLADYLRRLEDEIAGRADVPEALEVAIATARASLREAPSPRLGPRPRQRLLRTLFALRPMLGLPMPSRLASARE